MIKIKNCPICNNEDLIHYTNCRDHTVSKDEFPIVSCETCLLKITSPRPSESEIDKFYESENYISHTNRKSSFFDWVYQLVRVYTTERKVWLLKRNTKGRVHLDYGCGTGEFLNACAKSGFETHGVEPSKKARTLAEKNYNLSVTGNTDLSNFKKGEIKSISLWHVLEHVDNLNNLIKQIKKILSEEGKVFIAVPNHESWDCDYYKEYWAAWDVPIHYWHFSSKAVVKLFKKHGFKLVQKKPMLFDSFYISLLSEKYRNGKYNFIKSFIIGFASNLIGAFSKKGYSSQIYIFEKIK